MHPLRYVCRHLPTFRSNICRRKRLMPLWVWSYPCPRLAEERRSEGSETSLFSIIGKCWGCGQMISTHLLYTACIHLSLLLLFVPFDRVSVLLPHDLMVINSEKIERMLRHIHQNTKGNATVTVSSSDASIQQKDTTTYNMASRVM